MTAPNDTLRIIFAGTPPFAAYHLQALIDSQHRVVAVYTQPDRPAGRGRLLGSSPVKKLALAHGISVFQPGSLKNSRAQQELAAHGADVMVVVAYGLLLPRAVLDIPGYGCLNVHASLLPRWRGAAPIQRAIAAGDKVSGVTIMQMDAGLDTGDVLYKVECAISADETAASLHDKLMALGAPALLKTLDLLQQGELKPVKQNAALATYAQKITKAEALIDWNLPAGEINSRIRAYQPFPVAYTFINDRRLKIFEAEVCPLSEHHFGGKDPRGGKILAFNENGLLVACGRDALNIKALQLPGKKVMTAAQLLYGYRGLFAAGQDFGA